MKQIFSLMVVFVLLVAVPSAMAGENKFTETPDQIVFDPPSSGSENTTKTIEFEQNYDEILGRGNKGSQSSEDSGYNSANISISEFNKTESRSRPLENVTAVQQIEIPSFEEELVLSPVIADLPLSNIEPWTISSTTIKAGDVPKTGFLGKYLVGYCLERGQYVICDFMSQDNSLFYVNYFDTFDDLRTHLLMSKRISNGEQVYYLSYADTGNLSNNNNEVTLAAETFDQTSDASDNTLKYFEPDDYTYTYLGKEVFDCGDTRWPYPGIVKNMPYVSKKNQIVSYWSDFFMMQDIDVLDYSSNSISNITPFRYDPSGYNSGGGSGSGTSVETPLFTFQKNGKQYIVFSYNCGEEWDENSPYNSVDIAFVTDFPTFSECYRFYIGISPDQEYSRTSISVAGLEDRVIAYSSYNGKNYFYRIDRDDIIDAVGGPENIKVNPSFETDLELIDSSFVFRSLYDDIYYFRYYQASQQYLYFIDLSTGKWERFEYDDYTRVPSYIVKDEDSIWGYSFTSKSTGSNSANYYFTKYKINTSRIDFDPSTTEFPITKCQDYLYHSHVYMGRWYYCEHYLDFDNDRVYFITYDYAYADDSQTTEKVTLSKVVSLDISGNGLQEEFVDHPNIDTIRGRYWDIRAYEPLYPSSGLKSFDGRYLFNKTSGTTIALDTEALKDFGLGDLAYNAYYYLVDYSEDEFILSMNYYHCDSKNMTSYFVKAEKKETVIPPARTPTLITPINGEYVISMDTQFQWRKFDKTVKYALFIRDLETNQLVFNSLAKDQYYTGSDEELVSINSPINLLPGHKYRWNIWAFASDGEYVASESFDFNVVSSYPTGRPRDVLSPVEGPLMVKNSLELFGKTEKWRCNQHKSGGHVPGGGIGGSDDTYAWDLNLHKGDDTDVDKGKAVYAVASGVVADRYGVWHGQPVDGSPGTYGKIIIEHEYDGNKWYSAYLHLDNIQVEPGDKVDTSTYLGNISNTGTDNNHLHLVLYTGDNTLYGGLTSFDAHIVGFDKRLGFTPVDPMIGGLVTFNITGDDLIPYDLDDVKSCYWNIQGKHVEYPSDSKLVKKVVFKDPGAHIVTATVFLNDGTTHVFTCEVNVMGLEIGDILLQRYSDPPYPIINKYSKVPGTWKHAGIYVGDGIIIHSPGNDRPVCEDPLENWLYNESKCVRVLNVTTASTEEKIAAAEFAKKQCGKEYDKYSLLYPWAKTRKQADGQHGWYCSELAWGAYYNVTNGKIDLSIEKPNNNNGRILNYNEIVLPEDLDLSIDTKIRCEHIEEWPADTRLNSVLTFIVECPVEMEISDPDGLKLSNTTSEIEDAYYYSFTEDGDSKKFALIFSPKEGDYNVEVIPQSGASPQDTFTLSKSQSDQSGYTVSSIITQDYPISEISNDPYRVPVNYSPKASFDYSILDSDSLNVSFADTSFNDPTNWQWSFGDGNTSTERNPYHEYANPGNYSVSLSVSNSYGLDSGELEIILKKHLNANFSANVTSGSAPLRVQFNDTSAGDPTSWNWIFGDGNTTTDQHPVHTYMTPGTYTVNLTVSNEHGNTSISKRDYINVTAPTRHPATFVMNQNLVTGTDEDTITAGLHTGQYDYFMCMLNNGGDSGDTILQKPAFSIKTPDIIEYGWPEYAEYSDDTIVWNFPESFDLAVNSSLSTYAATSQREEMNFSLTLSRALNRTIFTAPGVQHLEFTLTFSDLDFVDSWGRIEYPYSQNVTASKVLDTIRTDAPVTWECEKDRDRFVFDKSRLAVGVPYHFSVDVAVATDHPVIYKPKIAVWTVSERAERVLPSGNTAFVPPEMLPEHVLNASAGSETETDWVISRVNQNVGTLDGVIRTTSGIRANFTANITSGVAPLTVQFTDTSVGNPTHWAWYFGDEEFTAPWTEMTASAAWSARYRHSSVVLPDNSIVLMGGYGDGDKNDVWRSTDKGATWTEMTASAGWSGRSGHTSVVLPDGSIVLMGGENGKGHSTNDIWRSTDKGATWMQMNASAGWSARSDHTSVALPDGSIVLMGGYDGGRRNDVWRSTDKGATWTEMTASAGWPGRSGHTSVVLPDGSIVLMGGVDRSYYSANDVWRSANNGATWTEMTTHAEWMGRNSHSSVVLPDGSIVLIGGASAQAPNDMWRSTDNGTTWKQIAASSEWAGRYSHTSVALPDGSIVLMGGADNSGKKNDVLRLKTAGASEQHPTKTYAIPGTYTVLLTVTNADGSSTVTKSDYITVKPAGTSPSANFTANVTSGTAPLTVHFTDTSIGTPTDRTWTFGDNATSTDHNPTHTYTAPGTYTVTLSINGGAETCTKTAYIKVTPVLYGDANDDNAVNQADTLRVLKEVVGLVPIPAADTEQFRKTDVHRNGAIDVGDALFIAQYNVGLRDVWFAVMG